MSITACFTHYRPPFCLALPAAGAGVDLKSLEKAGVWCLVKSHFPSFEYGTYGHLRHLKHVDFLFEIQSRTRLPHPEAPTPWDLKTPTAKQIDIHKTMWQKTMWKLPWMSYDVMICHVCPACVVPMQVWEWEDRSPSSAKDSSCTLAKVRRLQGLMHSSSWSVTLVTIGLVG